MQFYNYRNYIQTISFGFVINLYALSCTYYGRTRTQRLTYLLSLYHDLRTENITKSTQEE